MSRFKIGIVGGAGYIGSAIANCLSQKYTVKVLDKSLLPSQLEGKVEYEQCDILKYKKVEKAVKDLDLVIHTAIVQIPVITEQKKLGYEVNLLGTQNICRVADETPSIKGLILSSSWHVFGEIGLKGIIDEEFGFRPDKVEERARLYALSKTGQEVIVRYYDEMSEKIYGVIRMGTVLGEGMPKTTAANIFISQALKGGPITPFRHSMHRPMLYVDINDVCKAYNVYVTKILNGEICKEKNSLTHVVNLCWPKPITIIELAHIIRNTITKLTEGKVKPKIEIVDKGQPILYEATNKQNVEVNISKVYRFLGIKKLTDPQKSIERIIRMSLQRGRN